jgi:plastocyanin
MLTGFFVAASLAMGACGSGSTPTPTTAAPPSAAPPSAAPASAPASAAQSSAGGGAAGASAVTIQNFAFNPPTLTVKVGTEVTWTNQDSTTHTVTFDTGGAKSGNLAQGATYKQTFSSAGTLTYHCSIHPTMTATVTVTQ